MESLLNSLLGQTQALATIKNLHEGNMHHALYLYGPPCSGKSLAAHAIAQKILCEKKTGCGTCLPCKKVFLFRSESVLSISLDDRTYLLRFLASLFQSMKASEKKTDGEALGMLSQKFLLHTALLESYRILARHSQKILKLLKAKKASLPHGLPQSEKTIEQLIHRVHINLQKARRAEHRELALSVLLSPDHIEALGMLQNALDNGSLAKDSLLLAMRWAEHSAAQKFIIIKGIEKIHPLAVGLFLKHSEEPPPHTNFILVGQSDTAGIQHTVAQPLLSRTMKIGFRALEGESMQRVVKEKFGILAPFKTSRELTLQNFIRNYAARFERKDKESSGKKQNFWQKKNSKNFLALKLLHFKASDDLGLLLYYARQHPDELENLLPTCQQLLAAFIAGKLEKLQKGQHDTKDDENKSKEFENYDEFRHFPLTFSNTLSLLQLLAELKVLRQSNRIKDENILMRLALGLRKKKA